MELKFPHRMHYEASPTGIDDVINNLKAHKKLIEEGLKLLDKAIPGLIVLSSEIEVINIKEGTLFVDLLIQAYVEYQDTVEKNVVGGLENMTGTDIPSELETLATLATFAVVYFVARYAYDAVRSRKENNIPSIHIEGDYNTVVNMLGGAVNLSSAKIEDALHEVLPVSKRRSLLAHVSNLLRINKTERAKSIDVEGFKKIDRETIEEYPSDAELSEIDDNKNIDVPNARISIRAVDRDKTKAGWGAIVVGDKRFPKRLPMDLYPTVDPEKLGRFENVVGDITIEGTRDASGRFKPQKIHLLNFKEIEDTDKNNDNNRK